MAQEEARLLDHNYIGTEHLLLGLIREGHGVGARALETLGATLDQVRMQTEEIIGRGQQPPSGHIPFTPRAKKVLKLSLREALKLGHNYIGTEHLLLGMIREGDGVAAQVLAALGLDLARVREEVLRLLTGDEPGELESDLSQHHRLLATERRLAALEQRVGTGPATAHLDEQIQALRARKEAAIALEDFEKAAALRDQERQLQADKAARAEECLTGHPDLPTLAGQVSQLTAELEQLRSLLRQHGIDPGEQQEPA